MHTRLIESSYAEVASYYKLTTLNPSYKFFFSDLYTKNQVVTADDQSFHKMYNDNTFDIAFGSSA